MSTLLKVGLMSVGQMSVGQMSVGHSSVAEKSRHPVVLWVPLNLIAVNVIFWSI
jgi:hypothetical protein